MKNIKIAFLTNILTPYRISFYDELNRLLIEHGGEIRVYAMTDSLPLRPWNYYDLKREYTRLLSGKKFFIGKNDYLFNPSVVKEIMKFCPDTLIIAGSWTYPTFWIAVSSCRLKRYCKRLMWTESHNKTGINNPSKSNNIVQILKKILISNFDGYCVPGLYAKEAIEEIVPTDGKSIIALPNLVDSEYYDYANILRSRKDTLRKEKGISLKKQVFICPARFVDLKGIVPFLSNVSGAKGIDKATFIFIGGGPEKNQITNVAGENNLDVLLYDYQTPDEVRVWLALADVFLLPSLSDANPLSSIEAAWAGLPLCLSCHVGNSPELVDEGINGVVFETLSKEDVCKKVEFILNQSREWYVKAGKHSNNKAKKCFELKKESNRFIESLEEMLIGDFGT